MRQAHPREATREMDWVEGRNGLGQGDMNRDGEGVEWDGRGIGTDGKAL